jgi:transcriptional antiterminator NusG
MDILPVNQFGNIRLNLWGSLKVSSYETGSSVSQGQGIKSFMMEVPGEKEAVVPVGGNAEFSAKLKVESDSSFHFKAEPRLITEVEGSPDWQVKVYLDGVVKWDSYTSLPAEFDANLSTGDHWVTVDVSVAPGASFGDATEVGVSITSKGATQTPRFKVAVRPSILAVKTAIGQEREVADSIGARAKDGQLGIYSILLPSTIRGYVLIEAMNSDKIENAVRGIRKTHGLVKGETSLDEVSHFLTPKPTVSGIVEGDIVELVSGPFKGEKARVQRIDHGKEEITVELFEAVVPIPVTVRGDHVRVIEKDK